MNWQSILGVFGSVCAGVIGVFQVVKTLINNRKFNKFVKKVVDELDLGEVAKKIDYGKLADIVVKKLDEKIKNEVKC